MLKSEELLQPTSCLNKAAPNELVFVLRAKDALAPQTLRHWAAMAQGKHEPEKIAEALACADAMEQWRIHYVPEATAPAAVLCRVSTCKNPAERGRYYCTLHHD